MPFNGSGTFTRLRSWVNDAAANIRIRADYHDSEDDNFASGLSQCITKDGQTTVTANLPMANYRHTGVGEATAATHYARYDQVQLGKAVWADAGGTADAITASYSPNTITPVDGQAYFVRAGSANATTTPTFAPDGNTARTIVKYGDQALVAGDIAGDGHELILRYRLSDTKYELMNPATANIPARNNTFTGSNTFTGDVLFPDDGELTISSGAITVTGVYHTVRGEGAAADDLATISGGSDGQIIVIRADGEDITIVTTGNIDTQDGEDISLETANKQRAVLIYDDALSAWQVIASPVTVVDSSETAKGIIELLTDAEFNTGADSSRAVLASNFVKSISASGYITLPGGLILQWGEYTGGSSSGNITLPIAFTTAGYIGTATAKTANRATSVTAVSTTQLSFTSVICSAGSASAVDFYWFAIGK